MKPTTTSHSADRPLKWAGISSLVFLALLIVVVIDFVKYLAVDEFDVIGAVSSISIFSAVVIVFICGAWFGWARTGLKRYLWLLPIFASIFLVLVCIADFVTSESSSTVGHLLSVSEYSFYGELWGARFRMIGSIAMLWFYSLGFYRLMKHKPQPEADANIQLPPSPDEYSF